MILWNDRFGFSPDLIRVSSRERRRVYESKWFNHRVYTTWSSPVSAKANVGEGSAPQYEFAGALVGRLAAVGIPERAGNRNCLYKNSELWASSCSRGVIVGSAYSGSES